MARLGFQPTGRVADRHVEYYKDYAEPHGRVARCTVLFNKGGVISHLDHARLEKYIITVQGEVSPMVQEIERLAPKVMKGDMRQALVELEGLGGETAADEPLEYINCERCTKPTAEFALDRKGRKVCADCLITTIGEGAAQ